MAATAAMRPAWSKTSTMKALLPSGGFLAAVLGLGWASLRVKPAPFSATPQALTAQETIPLPIGLPAPVERFYRQHYGERVPVITTAVITGRGWLRLGGVAFPVRFRFIHQAGYSFRSYFELTAFGRPVMKVNEHFVDGAFLQEGTPGGEKEDPAHVCQSATLRMWAEALTWFPAILITDPRVHWQPIDDDTASLAVPFGQRCEHLIVRFDPVTGSVQYFEAMKYKNGTKTLWINGTWFDDGRPWAHWNIEDIAYNVDVDTSLAAYGP